MEPSLKIVGEHRCQLGESPVWDDHQKALFWVDAIAPAVWRYDPESGLQTHWPAPDVVGSLALSTPGFLIAALRNRICRLDLASGVFTDIAAPPPLAPTERLNDGKTDRAGRFFVASLTAHGTEPPVGKLYRFDGGACDVLAENIGVGNSLCFSPSGDCLYFADSVQMAVWAYDYDVRTGAVGERRTLIDTQPFKSAPDGATVDAEGYLWVALVHASQIGRFAPDGRLDRLVDIPIPYPSCPAFGGADMSTLYVAAISNSGGRLVTDHPDGGRLIAIDGLGVSGLVETRCGL